MSISTLRVLSCEAECALQGYTGRHFPTCTTTVSTILEVKSTTVEFFKNLIRPCGLPSTSGNQYRLTLVGSAQNPRHMP
jgi:hypothetical protein